MQKMGLYFFVLSTFSLSFVLAQAEQSKKTQPEVDFSQRLSNSFDTTPLGRQNLKPENANDAQEEEIAKQAIKETHKQNIKENRGSSSK